MVQMYKQDIQWMQGCEYLQRIRLRLNAPLERFYTTCCGTPIGFTSATLKIFPFFVVYRDLLVSSNEVDFNPVGYRLNVAKIPIAQRIWRRKQDSAMESEGVSVAFIMKLLTRMMYGIMVGKNEPDPTACIANSGHVEILQPNSAPK